MVSVGVEGVEDHGPAAHRVADLSSRPPEMTPLRVACWPDGSIRRGAAGDLDIVRQRGVRAAVPEDQGGGAAGAGVDHDRAPSGRPCPARQARTGPRRRW